MKRVVLKSLVMAAVLVGCAKDQKPTEPVTPPPAAAPVEQKVVVVHYKFDAFKLDKEQQKVIADALKGVETEVTVVGYTDSQGSKAYNKKLSEKRATEVVKYLGTLKVKGKVVVVDNKLLNKDLTKADHAANRRSELSFTVKVTK